MGKSVIKDSANIDQKVREAQIQLLYRQTWTGLVGVLIVALMACVALWPVVPHWKLSLWAGVSVILTLIRGSIILAFQRRTPFASDIDRWATLHVIGVVVSALIWGIPSFFLWPAESSAYQLVWPLLILPLGAAAVSTYHTWTSSYVSFLVLAVAPISIRFFIEGGHLFNILGSLSLFFIAVLLRAGRVMHSASVRSFEIGIRNEALNKDLREGIATRERLNVQLQQEVAERTLAEKEREKLIKELQAALEEIKTLAGVIPICMHCKGIRDDKGDWKKLEQYISEHSDAQFSHGICSDCSKKHYPEFE